MNRIRVILTFICVATSLSLARAEEVSFTRDIRPILSGRCFKCHGPDENSREADLRLDHRQEAIDYEAIVPGAPNESSLLERIMTDDPDLRMPPGGEPLTATQIKALERWIVAGANYEQHWAYKKPKLITPPQISSSDWPRTNPIDNFVQARLIKEDMQPSPPAEPAVLLRRLSLDLVGLPPTIEQVMEFEQDLSKENYEAAVDRLLRSKHFGEKWALHWLDLARYADSNGYQHDDLRTMWPYRDWVINALNRDLPFDQFTIEQLAGDLLPGANRDQLIATGFHRNVPTNFSGGSKVNEVRADVLHDRVSTTGQVWLGMTMECCQCHDHKFDPISQVDYYKLYAYFNQAVPELSMEGPGMFRKKFIGADLPVVNFSRRCRPSQSDYRSDCVGSPLLWRMQNRRHWLSRTYGKRSFWPPIVVRAFPGNDSRGTSVVDFASFNRLHETNAARKTNFRSGPCCSTTIASLGPMKRLSIA